MPNDYVIEDFDLQELPGSNEVAGDFDVGFRWGRFTASVNKIVRSQSIRKLLGNHSTEPTAHNIDCSRRDAQLSDFPRLGGNNHAARPDC
jgi:hypothetical protein